MSGAHVVPFETLSGKQRALLAALSQERVQSLVVGGYAVRVHGYLRPTEDLDLLIDCEVENLLRLRTALATLGASRLDEIVGHLSDGRPALVQWWDVQFSSSVGGRTYRDLLREAIRVPVEEELVLVVSRSQLIDVKRMAEADANRGDKARQDRKDIRVLSGGSRSAA